MSTMFAEHGRPVARSRSGFRAISALMSVAAAGVGVGLAFAQGYPSEQKAALLFSAPGRTSPQQRSASAALVDVPPPAVVRTAASLLARSATSSSSSSRLAVRAEKPGGPPMPSVPLGVARPGGGDLVRVELFLDLCCPFSAKLFKTVSTLVAPQYEGKVTFVVHSVAQPWHAQSSYMHEASLAVLDVAGADKFWEFSGEVFAQQSRFFDDMVYDKTRNDIYKELAEIAASVGVDSASVLERLRPAGAGNAGNAVTQRLKWATKLHRTRGVHVTPTVHLNFLEAGIVSSGWSADEWNNFLDYHVQEETR
mmetsp:Transcript_76963/g.220448  ORF Transcript_76963/g.220448 Transcript_76963/m.220448 type:complete len:309 (+) Transcript_76963:60-986(+)